MSHGVRKCLTSSITPDQEKLGEKLWARVYRNLPIGLSPDEMMYLVVLGALKKLNVQRRSKV